MSKGGLIIMEFSWIWKAALIVFVGTILLRIAGRKTISQMTLAETVLMIAIGSLLIQPVASKSMWMTFGVGTVLVLVLILLEYMQIKSDTFEKFITGKSKVLIENGNINEKNMKKLRITVDQLEMNLRQKNVTHIQDVEFATLEPNGQVGFTLKIDSQPATKKDIKQLEQMIQSLGATSNQLHHAPNQSTTEQNIFTEVENQGHKYPPPEHLQ